MPRNRNQPAVIVPLTWEQEASFSTMGNMLVSGPDETDIEVLVRVFCSLEAATAAWFTHRDMLMAEDPVAGRRPIGYWRFEQHREPPPSVEQAAILRELGELTGDEEATLEEWRRMVPEMPADLGIDQAAIAPRGEAEVPLFTNDIASADVGTVEDTHDIDGAIDAAPEPARPETAREAIAAAEEEVPEAEEVPVTPRILVLPQSAARRKPPELEGWESHDA
jgi:hypothetical protein